MSLKCPNCGGQVVYDPKQAKIVCKFCKGKTAAEDFLKLAGREAYDRENVQPENVWESPYASTPEAKPESASEPSQDEFMETNIYHCRSCGADLMITGTEASTFCSYCGSPTIVFDRVSKELRPKWIIPFKLTESEALESIRKRFKKGSYIPKKIKNLTVDKVHAIYMPYWLFNTYMRRGMIVDARTDNDGIFKYTRDASCHYENMTLDASMRLNNEMSRRLEPFHMNELVEFDVAYLSGFYADKYDVEKEALINANLERCRAYLDDAILDSCPRVNKVTIGKIRNYEKKNIREEYQIENIDYALLPAYFVNVKYDTGNQLVIVNGQTGKVVGNLPFEKERFIQKFIINSLIACPILMAVSYFGLFVPQVFMIPAAITAIMVYNGIKAYKNYKQGLYRLSASSMTSYVNNREDITW